MSILAYVSTSLLNTKYLRHLEGLFVINIHLKSLFIYIVFFNLATKILYKITIFLFFGSNITVTHKQLNILSENAVPALAQFFYIMVLVLSQIKLSKLQYYHNVTHNTILLFCQQKNNTNITDMI